MRQRETGHTGLSKEQNTQKQQNLSQKIATYMCIIHIFVKFSFQIGDSLLQSFRTLLISCRADRGVLVTSFESSSPVPKTLHVCFFCKDFGGLRNRNLVNVLLKSPAANSTSLHFFSKYSISSKMFWLLPTAAEYPASIKALFCRTIFVADVDISSGNETSFSRSISSHAWRTFDAKSLVFCSSVFTLLTKFFTEFNRLLPDSFFLLFSLEVEISCIYKKNENNMKTSTDMTTIIYRRGLYR